MLSHIETNLQTPAQFANANITHTRKRAVKQAVCQFDVIHHLHKAAHAYQRIDFLSLVDAGNLDFVIPVDFLRCVFQRCHILFRVAARSGLNCLCYVFNGKDITFFLIIQTFCKNRTIFFHRQLFFSNFRFKALSLRG